MKKHFTIGLGSTRRQIIFLCFQEVMPALNLKKNSLKETTEEENKHLRAENKLLKQERDILKKATAYFAKETL